MDEHEVPPPKFLEGVWQWQAGPSLGEYFIVIKLPGYTDGQVAAPKHHPPAPTNRQDSRQVAFPAYPMQKRLEKQD